MAKHGLFEMLTSSRIIYMATIVQMSTNVPSRFQTQSKHIRAHICFASSAKTLQDNHFPISF